MSGGHRFKPHPLPEQPAGKVNDESAQAACRPTSPDRAD
jgi:hypothetical protein